VRLFCALNLPGPERERLYRAAAPLRDAGLPVRWVAADALHVTVQFLGEVPEQAVPAVTRAAAGAAAGGAPFVMTVAGLGAFPGLRRPRIVWAGAAGPPGLAALHGALGRALAPLGWPPEARPFHAHVTLGRVRDGARAAQLAGLAPLAASFAFEAAVEVGTLDLMRSRLAPAGAQYDVVARLPLGGGTDTEEDG
jgi:RNA 2',3'-cyclic 3'-phosphodiesterase